MRINTALLVYVAVAGHLLFSFYIHSISVAPFALFSTILLGLIGFFSPTKNIKPLNSIWLIVFLLFGYIFISFVWSFLVHYFLDYEIYINSAVGFCLNIFMLMGWLTLSIKSKSRYYANRALIFFFATSLFLIVLQILSWYLLEVKIDYMQFVTGERQRLDGHHMNIAGITSHRVAGIFAEPAVYCWIMMGLGYFLFDRKASEVKKTTVALIFLLSIILTFSLSGIVLAFGVVLLKILSLSDFKKKTLVILVSLCTLFVVYPFLETYLVTRVGDIENDGSFNDKLQAFIVVWNYFTDPTFTLFGIGLGVKIETPSLNFILSSLLHLGIIGFLLVCYLIISVLIVIPGFILDKFFIFCYVVILGNHVTQTLTWFAFGAMCLLMVNNKMLAKNKN
jgi:hypothetical protein